MADSNIQAYEVKPHSPMNCAGYACGWYWDRGRNDEPRGPFRSERAAQAASKSAGERA